MTTRRVFLGTLASGLLAVPVTAEAQPAPRVYRIGVVLQGGPYFAAVDGLRAGLKELGFEEGKQSCARVCGRSSLERATPSFSWEMRW